MQCNNICCIEKARIAAVPTCLTKPDMRQPYTYVLKKIGESS